MKNMKKFRIPRKEKKKLKKGWYFHEKDSQGNSMSAYPHKNQEEYTLYKQGKVGDIMTGIKKRAKENQRKMNREVFVTDEEVIEMVDKTFATQYREEAKELILMSKNEPDLEKHFKTFVNAYYEGMINTCCMVTDSIKYDLKNKK